MTNVIQFNKTQQPNFPVIPRERLSKAMGEASTIYVSWINKREEALAEGKLDLAQRCNDQALRWMSSYQQISDKYFHKLTPQQQALTRI